MNACKYLTSISISSLFSTTAIAGVSIFSPTDYNHWIIYGVLASFSSCHVVGVFLFCFNLLLVFGECLPSIELHVIVLSFNPNSISLHTYTHHYV